MCLDILGHYASKSYMLYVNLKSNQSIKPIHHFFPEIMLILETCNLIGQQDLGLRQLMKDFCEVYGIIDNRTASGISLSNLNQKHCQSFHRILTIPCLCHFGRTCTCLNTLKQQKFIHSFFRYSKS